MIVLVDALQLPQNELNGILDGKYHEQAMKKGRQQAELEIQYCLGKLAAE